MVNAPKSVIGIQSHNKANLKYYITKYNNIKIVLENKPSWFVGKWKKVYSIQKK